MPSLSSAGEFRSLLSLKRLVSIGYTLAARRDKTQRRQRQSPTSDLLLKQACSQTSRLPSDARQQKTTP